MHETLAAARTGVPAGHPIGKRVKEELRKLVDGERVLGLIEECVNRLMAGEEPYTCMVTRQTTQVPLTRERIASLKVVLDVQLRLLSKVLPDLKAVELTGADGEQLGQTSDRLVLATKLLAIMRSTDPEQLTVDSQATEMPDFLL